MRVLEYKILHTHQTRDVCHMFVTSGKYRATLWRTGGVWEMTKAFSDWQLCFKLFSYWIRPHEVAKWSSIWNHWFWWWEASWYVQRLGFCVKKKKAWMALPAWYCREKPSGTKVQIKTPCLCKVQKYIAAVRLLRTEASSAGLKIFVMLTWLHCHFLKCCQ